MERIGEKIKKIRSARGFTQSDMAEALGVSRAYYTQWESGARRINAEQLIELSKVVGVTLDYFSDEPPQRSLFQLMAQLKLFFESPEVSDDEKEKAYQCVMRLYLNYKESAAQHAGISVIKKHDADMPVAAHTDKKITDEELELMRQDIDEL